MNDLKRRGIGMTSQRTRDRLIQRLKEEGIRDPMVLETLRSIPRHLFVDEALASRAYDDTALPIGHGQTLSQPYVVARMTEILLRDGPLDKVLEIGTGSGYQAAVLARLVKEVYTVERLSGFVLAARRRFQELNLRNVRARHADGMIGWPEHAPFDGILATAAPEGVPPALLAQLAVGGRLIIPVGDATSQGLTLITRTAEGYRDEVLERVVFVPMRAGTQ
jgi:protein-L-isoaspartate(D-aspartate) O-methyltransferase